MKNFAPMAINMKTQPFKPASIRKVGNVRLSDAHLDRLIDMEQYNLFGNRGKAVSDDSIDLVGYSLTLIKVVDFQVIRRDSDGQLRMQFEFNHNRYDLPVTDIDFVRKYNADKALLEDVDCLYLTISLGFFHNGWHSKLIAGVLY